MKGYIICLKVIEGKVRTDVKQNQLGIDHWVAG